MEKATNIVSKILIYENQKEAEARLRSFCEENSLIGLKACNSTTMDIFTSNTDLGGVIISEMTQVGEMTAVQIATKIHDIRPELPIFLRMNQVDGKNLALDKVFAGYFAIDRLDLLRDCLNKYLFTTYYPMALIRGMQEIYGTAIAANLKNCDIYSSAPYLVNDQVIYGELMSLIPMESSWYRGYMMLQTTEENAINLIKQGQTPLPVDDTGYRAVNSLLNEITNLMWGGIKSRFPLYKDEEQENLSATTQIPISINHHHKYISFGSSEPQLCFHYIVQDKKKKYAPIDLYQKFIFNLSWVPENYMDSQSQVEKLVDDGELEFF